MRYLIVLLLTGCASTDMVKVAEPKTVVVTWVRELPNFCGDQKLSTGCARVSRDFTSCTIWVPEGAPEYVLGHELLHCFGYDHAANVQRNAEALRRATRNSVQWDF